MAIRKLGGHAQEPDQGQPDGSKDSAESPEVGGTDLSGGSTAAAEPPREVAELERMLAAYDWWAPESDVVSARADLESQVGRCEAAGFGRQARAAWSRIAPRGQEYPHRPALGGEPRVIEVRPEQIVRDGPASRSAVSLAEDAGWGGAGSGYGFGEPHRRSLFDQHSRSAEAAAKEREEAARANGQPPMDLLSLLLSVPGVLAGYGWQAAKSLFSPRHADGFLVSERQLGATADRIVRLSEELREQGMRGLVERMRSTGRSASEVFAGMGPGGPFEAFGGEFRELLKNPAFARLQASLENELANFRFMAERHARMGVDAGRDYSEAIERNLERIVEATEGMILKKGSSLLHVQDVARAISSWVVSLLSRGPASTGAPA